MRPIREWQDVGPVAFAEIRALAEPAVMRGLAADWPLVRAAGEDRAAEMLRGGATDRAVAVMRAPPEVEGRMHYGERIGERNFTREQTTLPAFFDALTLEAGKDQPDALALQGLPAPEALPGFAEAHRLAFLPEGVPPRLWIGNAAKVAIHHDPSENVAVVGAGRRRFSLFPPEAVSDLYMGPFDPTPAGVQVSMVHLTAPDMERYPRFERALAVGLTADLEPGDAIYIPFQWYHHVESVEPFNVLVNFWWDPARRDAGSPWDAMMHGLLSLRTLPPDQKRAWKAMFDHYVFEADGPSGAHLPEEARGALGEPTPGRLAAMRKALKDRVGR